MKVVILMPLAEQRGGAEQLLLELMQHRGEANVNWTVVFFSDGPMREAIAAQGVETHVVEMGRLREMGRYVRGVGKLKRIFEREKVDLVFSWMAKAHLYGGIAAWLAGIPALWYQHGIPTAGSLMDRLVTLLPAKGIVACSQFVAEAQKSLWPQRNVHVKHPCADLARFNPEDLPTPQEARNELGLPSEGPLVGIVGRLQRWKGIHVFIEAMPHILEKHADAHGVVVGGKHDLEPDYAGEIESLIDRMGLQEHVTLAGYQSDVPLWMQAMDVFVHASDHEPFGIVIVEAMALGKPIVAGDQGGPTEIITDGVNGLMTPYGDAEALARQVMRYLDEPIFAHKLGERAQKRARDFAPGQYAQNLTQTLQSIV